MKYKLIAEFPGYRVSDTGVVQSRWSRRRKKTGYGTYYVLGKTWKTLHPWEKSPGGYLTATLYRDGKQHRRKVHCLVLEAFVGPRPAGQETRHLDGDPQNNCVSNLAWGTRAENLQDKREHGRDVKGEAIKVGKLSTDQVLEIIRRLREGARQVDLAKEYGVSQPSISAIAIGKTWLHLTRKE